MMERMKALVKQFPMRRKMIVLVLVIFLGMMGCTWWMITHYHTKNYTELQQQYNEAVMQEISSQLDTVSSSIHTLYRSFNSQKLFTEETVNGETLVQSIYNQIQFEQLVSDVINATNLQELIKGTMFYLTEDCYYYVGRGVAAQGWSAEDAEWFREYCQSGMTGMFYGPIMEDFKPAGTRPYESLYYIAPYAKGSIGNSTSFLMFSLDLEIMMELIEENSVGKNPLYIIGRSGELIDTIGSTNEEGEAILPAFIRESEGKNGSLSYFDEGQYISAYYQDQFDWWIVFADEYDSFFAGLQEMYRNLVLMMVVFLVLSILMIVFSMNRVMMPLTTLNRFIDIMQNDPDAYIDAEPQTEIGRIGVRLNEMKKKIQIMSQEMYQLQIQERDAQVSALQAQINPHFIYNTLDNIYCMAQLEETEPIMQLSENLSQMMRYSLSMKTNLVPLQRELEHIESYISILNIRFDDRIQLINEIDETLYAHPVLKLSLQPIIENAWKHGLNLSEDGGKIRLKAEVRGEVLELSVENSGSRISEAHCEEINKKLEHVRYGEGNYKESHGISLENINNRLKLTFGPRYGLVLQPGDEDGCRTVMRMPFSDNKKE